MLYQLVQDHLNTFLESTKERYAKGLPRYVMEELEGYLRCGIFAHGFTRCHCPEELSRIVCQVRDRSLRWLRAHGYLDERPAEDRSSELPVGTAIEACADLALRGGAFAKLDRKGDAEEDNDAGEARFAPRRRGSHTFEVDGWSVQAAVRIEANDDEGRERLCRYCTRPSFALERISVLPDGHIAYRIKYPTRGKTHRIMTPVEFLARLVALIPPPKYPLVRYSGVLAPHSKWRSAIVPRGPSTARQDGAGHAHGGEDSARGRTAEQEQGTRNHPAAEAEGSPFTRVSPSKRSRTRAKGHKSVPTVAAPAPTAATLAAAPVPAPLPALGPGSIPAGTARDAVAKVEGRVEFGFNIITVHHWDRLLGGALLATSPRVPWATLLRRTFEIDVTRCPRCHGRMRILSVITQRATIQKILDHLGLSADPPTAKPGRSPTWNDDPPIWADG